MLRAVKALHLVDNESRSQELTDPLPAVLRGKWKKYVAGAYKNEDEPTFEELVRIVKRHAEEGDGHPYNDVDACQRLSRSIAQQHTPRERHRGRKRYLKSVAMMAGTAQQSQKSCTVESKKESSCPACESPDYWLYAYPVFQSKQQMSDGRS